MPPKSTWFEPKLRSGLFVHSFKINIDFISLKNRNDFSFGFSYFKRVFEGGGGLMKLQVGEKNYL